jgi:adenylosuccinate synthase
VHAVVRFNGGAQAAHNVLTVDRDALLTTPYHRAANRARELARGQDRHGSCGMGIGETARYALEHPGDAPRAADCAAPRTLARKLGRLRDRLADEFGSCDGPDLAALCDAYRAFAARVPLVGAGYLSGLLRAGPVVFEGAQGVLLDEWRGFHPYTTWSTTTFANAETLLAESGTGAPALRLGVVRCYLTRHGPGPFVTEDPTLELPERQRLTRIIPGPERDLQYQERLTTMLLGARPVYEHPGPEPARRPVRHARYGWPRRPPAAV